MLFSFISFLFLIIPSAYALSPVVKGAVVTTPGVPTAEARTYATQKDKLLLSDYLDSTRPGSDSDQMLKSKLERAQRAWLSGDLETARSHFRAITELAMKADWRNDQREVIQAAFLRMAQSSESSTERGGWLESALRLYGDLAPDATIFPPPLLNEFEATKKRLPTVTIELADAFSDFRYLLIDGRRVDLASENHVELTTGLHRLTALSDSHESVTEFMTAAQLRVLRLSPPPLTEGLCERAKLRSRNALPSGVELFAGSGCKQGLTSILDEARLVTAAPLSMPASVEPRDRTWLYVIGGAVLAGAAYAIANHQQQSSGPTHRSGFSK